MPMLGFERHEIIEAIVEGFAGRDLSFLEAPPETHIVQPLNLVFG